MKSVLHLLESCRQGSCTGHFVRLVLECVGVLWLVVDGQDVPAELDGGVVQVQPLVDPLLLEVVSAHGGDPGGGVHGDVAKLVQCRHFELFLGLNTLCPLASYFCCSFARARTASRPACHESVRLHC